MNPIADNDGKSILRQRTTDVQLPECGICGRTVVHADEDHTYHCPTCDNTWELELTNHVVERWDERSRVPDRDIRVAWSRAIRFIDEGTRVKGDEFRYNPPSMCLLIRKDSSLVTAEYVPETRVQIQRATVRSLIADDTKHTQHIATVCNECNISVDKLREIARYENGVQHDISDTA